MRRTAVERQGRKPQPCRRKARVSDAVSRQQDKQKIQELIGGAIITAAALSSLSAAITTVLLNAAIALPLNAAMFALIFAIEYVQGWICRHMFVLIVIYRLHAAMKRLFTMLRAHIPIIANIIQNHRKERV